MQTRIELGWINRTVGAARLGVLGLCLLLQASSCGVEATEQGARSEGKRGPINRRSLTIQGASKEIASATLEGPVFHSPSHFQGFEEYHHPRLRRLRQDYDLDNVVAGERNEFRRLLKLRHWVHTRWAVDNDQRFEGDAFAILEKAKTGAGFHCSHSMTVQEAVMSAMGYVARNVLVDRNHEDLGRSAHHGVNEVWSNNHAKWVLFDAKYDIHFEREGVPLSALELHESVRADGGRGVVMVRGVESQTVADDDSQQLHEATKRSFWWVAYSLRPFPFTHPDWTGVEQLLIFNNAAFRESKWLRDHGHGLTPHWAYAAGAFVPTEDRYRIEWTPGVPDLRVRQVAPAELEVEVRSATPNFEACVVRINGAPPRDVPEGPLRWTLSRGDNSFQVRTRNLFGVLGPNVTAAVRWQPRPTRNAQTRL